MKTPKASKATPKRKTPASSERSLEWLKNYEDEVLGRAAGERARPYCPVPKGDGLDSSEYEG